MTKKSYKSCFNPRARVGRDLVVVLPARTREGFNPRARVGRDAAASASARLRLVSIHAPAWGATKRVIPALTWLGFQSTRPRGARRMIKGHFYRPVHVSIHAPAWGATPAKRGQSDKFSWFQSTRPRGARRLLN